MTSVDNPSSTSTALETLARSLVEDAFQAALLHLQHPQTIVIPEKNHQSPDSDEESTMDTVVASPIRKSSLSSFQNRQLRDGRKRSVTFNPTLIQEFIIDESKITEKPRYEVERREADKLDDQDTDEEITKL